MLTLTLTHTFTRDLSKIAMHLYGQITYNTGFVSEDVYCIYDTVNVFSCIGKMFIPKILCEMKYVCHTENLTVPRKK